MLLVSLVAISTYARVAASQPFPGDGPGPPKEHTGFQLGLRTGVAIPLGTAGGSPGVAMSDVFSPQVPIILEIGGKPIPNLFIGGYLDLSFGGAGGQQSTECDLAGVSCFAVNARLGAEVQYHILPGGNVNPWLGYGIGYESGGISATEGNVTSSYRFSGLEFAHFMAGLDFRLSRAFGLGPFLGFSLGQYSRYHLEGFGSNVTQDGDIAEKALHEWLTLGLRTVFFP
jgi:hypothetical protein